MQLSINKIVLLFALVYGLVTGCTSSAETVEDGTPSAYSDEVELGNAALKSIVHYNVIVTPDLSNRLLNPKPVSDAQVVNTVLKNIYPTILKHGKTVNQYDLFSTSLISNKLITQLDIKTQDLQIDFSKFQNDQLSRINYITGKSPKATLAKDKQKFLSEFTRVEKAAAQSTHGADLWTYFNSGISSTMLKDKGPESSFNNKVYTSQYRNIMILLTDGYIEAGMFGKKACKSGNQCYYLSGQKVKEFRNAFKKSGSSDMNAFFQRSKFGLVPANNNNLKNLEVLVLQMEDRSLDTAGSATVYPTDMEIMQLFWADWLKKSGVKRFELKPALSSASETEKVILNFMGI